MSESISAFTDCGQEPGLVAWRMEQFKPVEAEASGTMSAGDAYLYLHTVTSSAGALQNTVHFWIGEKCSQDEAASAAIMATQLDTALGGSPTICRHAQNAESPEFLQLFPNGVFYTKDGVASGLSKADIQQSAAVLYKISGKRAVRTCEVTCTSSSLNTGDCFVLDTQDDLIIQWIGDKATSKLKHKTLDLACKVRNDFHAGNSRITILSQGEVTGDDASTFYKSLGVDSPQTLTVADVPTEDVDTGPPRMFAIKYVCEGDEEGTVYTTSRAEEVVASHKLEPVTTTLSASMLTADAAFALIAGGTVWIWTGVFVPMALKKQGLDIADEALKEAGHTGTLDAPASIVKQGLESPLFKQHFPDWDRKEAQAAGAQKAMKASQDSGDAPVVHTVDVDALASGVMSQQEVVVDDGSGKKKVWRIEQFKLEPVTDEAHYGRFNSGDSYVVLYEYGLETSPQHIVYMWQGQATSLDERGACALCAVQIDTEMCGGGAAQVRIIQGKEPRHFSSMWGGKMVINLGGVASGFKTLAESDSAPERTASRLYHVKGSSTKVANAVEVKVAAESLNSGDMFVLVTADSATAWAGKFCSPAEKEAGNAMLETVISGAAERTISHIDEDSEPDSFWEDMGGKGEYSTMPNVSVGHEPRLFQINDSSTGGKGIAAEEVFHFCQADLENTDVMLLDTFSQIFLWVGSESSENEQEGAIKLAEQYLSAGNRDADTPVTKIKAAHEPSNFTSYFHGWDSSRKPITSADYEARVAELRAQSGPALGQDVSGASWSAAAEAKAKAAAEIVSNENEPPAPATPDTEKTATKAAEEPITPSVKDAVQAGNTVTTSVTPLNPTMSPGAKSRNLNLTPHTIRGTEFEASEGDPSGSKPVDVKFLPGQQDKFSPEKLKGMNGADGIDPTKKELYLSDEDFLAILGMDREAFDGLALWKKNAVKKDCGLF